VRISKSKFVAGVQCLKRLYLQVHQPELATQPDAAAEAIIRQGHEVGMLARTLFPGGVEVDRSRGLADAIRTTRELIANPAVPAIFEGVFEYHNVLVKVDILHRRRDGRWRLIEVKSTSEAKDHHLEDVSIQYRVVSRSGVDVASACLAHVNRNYVRGKSIDAKRFFRIRNVTRRIQRLQPNLTFQLRSEFSVLEMPQPPDVKSGKHCTAPVTCEFFERCKPRFECWDIQMLVGEGGQGNGRNLRLFSFLFARLPCCGLGGYSHSGNSNLKILGEDEAYPFGFGRSNLSRDTNANRRLELSHGVRQEARSALRPEAGGCRHTRVL
jgi:hypothetical protein